MSSSRRPSVVLLVVLLVALASGGAASLLIGAAAAHSAPSGPATQILIPTQVLGDALVAIAVVVIGYLIYLRLTGGTAHVPNQMVVYFLVAILVGVLFVAAFRTFGVGGPGASGNVSSGTGNGTSPGSGSSPGQANFTSSGGFSFVLSIHSWLPYVILVGVALVTVLVGMPRVRSMMEDRRSRRGKVPPSPDARKEMNSLLQQAEEALDRGGDPRTVILALYLSVLNRLTSMVGSLDLQTPEEIRANHLVRLGIRPDAAESLTRLFEEARYSSHPLDASAAERARGVVREALADLARSPLSP